MITFRNLLFVLLTLLYSCTGNNNEVLITGKIHNTYFDAIKYSVPLKGTNFWGFNASTKVDSLGNFKIITKVDKPSFIQIFPEGLPTLYLIVEPNNQYEITINYEPRKPNYIIRSPIEKVQKYYSDLININPRSCDYWTGDEITEYSKAFDELKKKMQQELTTLYDFHQNKNISKETYNLLKTDREIHYLTAQASLACINTVNTLVQNKDIPQGLIKLWGNAVQSIPIENPNFLSSNYAYEFLDMYYWYKAYSSIDPKDFLKTRNDYRAKGLIHTHSIELAKNFFSGVVLEYYTATYIYFNTNRKRHEKEFISIFEDYKKNFPNSHYTTYLIPQINEIESTVH